MHYRIMQAHRKMEANYAERLLSLALADDYVRGAAQGSGVSEAQPKTAINFPWGKFEMTSMPAEVQSALTALESERGKLQKKDKAMDAQLKAIQASLEKLAAGLHTA